MLREVIEKINKKADIDIQKYGVRKKYSFGK